jgi:hypothetical protein
MYEHRNTDNACNLAQLHEYDTGFRESDIISLIEQFFDNNLNTNLEPASSEKTVVLEEYSRDGNIFEGIISTGYHGYEAEFRDVDTGRVTYNKGEDEAEQMPLYFLAYRPDTQAGEPYDNGHSTFLVFQQVNRIGVKTKFKKHLEPHCLHGVSTRTTLNINPVSTENVYQKVLDSERITKVDMRIKKAPADDESMYHLLQGLDTEDIGTQSLVWRPEHGGRFPSIRNLVARASDSDTQFAEFVDDDVENFTVTIKNDQGRSETFSLMSEEIAMRKDLDNDRLDTVGGLITADELRSEANDLINDIVNTNFVEPLEGATNVER